MAAALPALFASGHAVDIVLAVLALEFAWLVRRCGWSARAALLRLAPGALMLLGVRAALTGEPWYAIALPLLLSFPIHLADLARPAERRQRRPGRRPRRAGSIRNSP